MRNTAKQRVLVALLVAGLLAGLGWLAWERWGWWRFMDAQTVSGSVVQDSVSLGCRLRVSEGTLAIELDVRNGTSADIYVFDHGTKGSAPDVVFLDKTGMLHVILGVPPMPAFTTAWLYHPDESRLAPGEHNSIPIALSLPLREESHYYQEDESLGPPVRASRVRVALDLLRANDPGFQLKPVPRGSVERIACELVTPSPIPIRPRQERGFETQREAGSTAR